MIQSMSIFAAASNREPSLVFLLVLLGVGLFRFWYPQILWKWTEAWKSDDEVRPSGPWIVSSRIGAGWIVLIAGCWLLSKLITTLGSLAGRLWEWSLTL